MGGREQKKAKHLCVHTDKKKAERLVLTKIRSFAFFIALRLPIKNKGYNSPHSCLNAVKKDSVFKQRSVFTHEENNFLNKELLH